MKKHPSLTVLLFCSIFLFQCQKGKKSKEDSFSLNEIKDLKTRQYAIEGRTLYNLHCANCHQKDGKGLAKLIPPLRDADFMNSDVDRTIGLIRHGIKGEITVNQVRYNQPMPPNPQLTHLEIAEITTYIYYAFGEEQGLIDAQKVKESLGE